jgi:hypothetical protein
MHKISGDVRTNGSNCLQNTKFRIDPVLAEEHHGKVGDYIRDLVWYLKKW